MDCLEPASEKAKKAEAKCAIPRKPRILLAACGTIDAVKFVHFCDCFAERAEINRVAHIELRRWADVLVIAPLSENTLGKIERGLWQSADMRSSGEYEHGAMADPSTISSTVRLFYEQKMRERNNRGQV
ncbi:Phosphopantothenoylcysteine decarboxylase [Glycine soja]|nr:Phosphopantothenoylcysteine decarboxylase [Glycine soja]